MADSDGTFARPGSIEAAEHGGFTADFVNALRTHASEGQGMTLVGTHFWYFPDAKGAFSKLTATDLDNYYRRAYSEEERAELADELAMQKRNAREAKRTLMKGSDALVPHMFIPFKVGYALEKQFPDEFSMSVRKPRAMAILESLMPDWVLIPQYGMGAA